MLYGVPSSFNFQICLLSSVWLLLSLLLKLALCAEYLVLNDVAVNPIYLLSSFGVVTFAS